MSSSVLGFYGVEAYDLMYYLALTAVRLGNRVAMVDVSEDRSLAFTVPNFEDFQQMPVISYRGIDVAVTQEVSQFVEEYDYVLVYFGFNRKSAVISECTELYLVTDMQLHNLWRMRDLPVAEQTYVFAVIREKYDGKAGIAFLNEFVHGYEIAESDVIYVSDDSNDLRSKLLCQYNSRFSFKQTSESMRNFVVRVLSVDFDSKAIASAFRIASRGC